MDDLDTPNILAVGARLANLARRAEAVDANVDGTPAPQASVTEVNTARQALALLRVMPFDLVAVGSGLTDASAEGFARTLRQAKPWQKWVSIESADESTDGAGHAAGNVAGAVDEVIARTLGALAILDGGPDAWPQLVELARRVRRRNPAMVVPGLKLAGRMTTTELDRTTPTTTTSAAI